MLIVKPQTVIRWHRQGFRLYQRWGSGAKRMGRPTIPREHIALIRRMNRDNPPWGEARGTALLALLRGYARYVRSKSSGG